MDKIFIKGTSIVLLFFSVLFVFRQIDWMTLFRIKEIGQSTEQKLGELFWEYYSSKEVELNNEFITSAIDSIVFKLCDKNDIDQSLFKLHIIENTEVNAFALPDGHLVLHTGLIAQTENEAQLSGVIAHEMAHIQEKHIMKKLLKEIGLSVLLTTAAGTGGTEIIKEMAKLLSSSSFDRTLEEEADLKAVEYMVNAGINADEFATFLYIMSLDEGVFQSRLTWINTHPNSEGRAEYILKQSEELGGEVLPVLATASWGKIQLILASSEK